MSKSLPGLIVILSEAFGMAAGMVAHHVAWGAFGGLALGIVLGAATLFYQRNRDPSSPIKSMAK